MAGRTRKVRSVGLLTAALTVGLTSGRADAQVVHLEPFSTEFNNPIGIDFYEPTPGLGQLILSVNYPTGSPNNLDLIDADGTHTPYSSLARDADELKIATVRAGPCTGGFPVGTVFIGVGGPGQPVGVARVDPAGTLIRDWVTLPAGEAFVRGSLYQDRTCAFDGDLIVVTGNPQEAPDGDPSNFAGRVWRINSLGIATLVVDLGKHLEGVITVPDDPDRFGPLAGRIVVGDEDRVFPGGAQGNGPFGKVFGIKSATDIITVGAADPRYAAFPHYPTSVPMHPEDLDLVGQVRPDIPGDGDLFAVDFGGGQILRAPALDFLEACGSILVTQEFPDAVVPSGLSTLRWDGSSYVVTPLVNAGTAIVGHYEHVSFRGGTDCTRPNLSVQKVALQESIVPGDTASFAITVLNEGPGTAANVTMTDALPAGLAWSTDRPDVCELAGDELTCAIGTLVEGASFSVTLSAPTDAQTVENADPVTMMSPSCRIIPNSVSVSSRDEDPDRLDDNTASAVIQLCAPPKKHKKQRITRHKPTRKDHKQHYDGDGCDIRGGKHVPHEDVGRHPEGGSNKPRASHAKYDAKRYHADHDDARRHDGKRDAVKQDVERDDRKSGDAGQYVRRDDDRSPRDKRK